MERLSLSRSGGEWSGVADGVLSDDCGSTRLVPASTAGQCSRSETLLRQGSLSLSTHPFSVDALQLLEHRASRGQM